MKDEPQVTEDLTLVPISVYNKTKMVAERVFLSYADQMQVHCIRPATVCGLSPRMRLDVSVNMLTYQGLKNGKITVFGGSKPGPTSTFRIWPMCIATFSPIQNSPSGCYNAGFENLKILEIAQRVQQRTGAEDRGERIQRPTLLPPRFQQTIGYWFSAPVQCSSMPLMRSPLLTEMANLPDGENCYTVKWMKHLQLEAEQLTPWPSLLLLSINKALARIALTIRQRTIETSARGEAFPISDPACRALNLLTALYWQELRTSIQEHQKHQIVIASC